MTATEAKKPKGRADACLATDRSASNANLMAQALARENLQRAWEQVRANHGAPGVDGMTYFALSEYYSPVPILDEWIRRRLRMCYWSRSEAETGHPAAGWQ